MYLAEIHGKLSRENENKEDILTSNVFSFFKYANREIFLFQFIKSLNLNITIEDARLAEFYFWPSYPDRTEPDLVILIGDYYLLIEAKYHSGFGKETPILKPQLARELKGGLLEAQNLDKSFKLIIVTGDNYFKREIRDTVPEKYRKDLIWINWQSIAYLVNDLLENVPNISLETNLIAEDLYRLLLKKRLRNYEGVKVLSKVRGIKKYQDMIFFQAKTATYRGDFIGFRQALETQVKFSPTPSILFFGKRLTLYQSFSMLDLNSIENGTIFFRRSGSNE